MSTAGPPLLRAAPPHTRAWDVAGFGQCSFDHVCIVDGLPGFASKAPILEYTRLPGGQVATATRACARLGLRTAYCGRVGDDEAAREVLAPLRAEGVDVSAVRTVSGAPTQLAVILLDRRSGERTVLWYRDPALRLAPDDAPAGWVEAARLLHVDGADPVAAAALARRARAAGAAVMLDADHHAPGLEELLPLVDFPIVSRELAEAYSGTGSVRDALARLVRQGARLAVVTLGELGALGFDGERELRAPAFEIEPRDTTGAGDVFHAAFAWAALRGLHAEAVLVRANAAAALSCLGVGAQGLLPTPEEVERFLASHRMRAWREPPAAPGGGAPALGERREE